MKKVKIALAALAVLAVASGTLAFKAQKTFGSIIYVGPVEGELPTSTLVNWKTTAPNFPGAVTTFATTTATLPVFETYITIQQ